jgi:hypothetical protein
MYANVDLKTNKQCKLLSVLAKRPGVVRHIRKLAVRPNNAEWTLPEEPINEVAVSDLVSRMAVQLTSLHTFIWDGLEQPEDQLWLKLRKSCPHLVNIGTTVGEEPVENTSHVCPIAVGMITTLLKLFLSCSTFATSKPSPSL